MDILTFFFIEKNMKKNTIINHRRIEEDMFNNHVMLLLFRTKKINFC